MTGPASRPIDPRSAWLVLRSQVIDRIAAVALGALLAPLFAGIAGYVWRRDGLPVAVGLDRVGQGGRSFRMWKFRTMVMAPETGSAITAVGDTRITSAGQRLRRWRLDELPQILNVARGDMALLGPRPETPSLVDQSDPRWQRVLAVRPGITGPTQLLVERWEGLHLVGSDHEDRYRLDILPVKLAVDRWYVEHSTPVTDILVGWSMIERFVLGRDQTAVTRLLRSRVPEASSVPCDDAEGAPRPVPGR